MPSEHRQISFTLEEIIRAVTELMSHHRVLPAHGKIVGLRVTETGEQLAAMVSVTTKDANKIRELPLTAELLGAALIRLCREARIPLPRAAQKRLVRAGDGVAMHINMNAAEAPISTKAPVDREALTVASPGASEPDPYLPDWWSTMSRRR